MRKFRGIVSCEVRFLDAENIAAKFESVIPGSVPFKKGAIEFFYIQQQKVEISHDLDISHVGTA